MKLLGGIFLICLALCSCSSDKKLAPTEGRLSLLEDVKIKSSHEKIIFEQSKEKATFLVAGENAKNKRIPSSYKTTKESWTKEIGTFSTPYPITLNKILIDEKNIYTLDEKGLFSQLDTKGKILFQKPLLTNEEALSLTSKNNEFFILTTMGTLIKTDKKGHLIWQKKLNTPFRNEPVLYKEKIYLLSASNNLWVFDIKDGTEIWHAQTDSPATTLWTMGRPAINNNIVIVPFSNGLVHAFQAQTGAFLWETDMMGAKTFNQESNLTQMVASPVIDEKTVYLVGHADITKALNLSNGKEIWTLPIGGNTTPFLNGNTLFILDNQSILHAINKKNGQQFWAKQLPFESKIPVLSFINDELVLFYPEKTFILSPKTGDIKAHFEHLRKMAIPVCTQKGLYILTQDGKLNYQGFLQ